MNPRALHHTGPTPAEHFVPASVFANFSCLYILQHPELKVRFLSCRAPHPPSSLPDDTHNRKLESLTNGMTTQFLHVSLKCRRLARSATCTRAIGACADFSSQVVCPSGQWLLRCDAPDALARGLDVSASPTIGTFVLRVCVPSPHRLLMINFVTIYAGNYRLSFSLTTINGYF